jgi:ATP-dependent DNA helicase RecG
MTAIDRVKRLIVQGEGQEVEFKQEFITVLDAELVAFANTNDGTILIGVRDDGQVCGVEGDPRRIEERLMGLCRVNCTPPLTPIVEVVNVEDKLVLVVQVREEWQRKPYRARGICYVRTGSTSRRATQDEEYRLAQEAGRIIFDQSPIAEATFADLDQDKLRRYLATRLPEALDANGRTIAQFIEHADLPLVVRHDDTLTPTLAGLLMFGQQPQRFLPQAFVSAVRFAGNDMDVSALDRVTLRGTLDELIQQGLAFVQRNMRVASLLQDERLPYRTDVPEYPLRAAREAITNAVVHRDYSYSGRDVVLRMFDDRLEISSPGGLLPELTSDDLGTGKSASRNPTLAQAMREMGLVERFGTGVRLMRREMQTNGSAAPVFTLEPDTFTVTLPARELELWQNHGTRRL